MRIAVRGYQLEPRRVLAGTRGSYGCLTLRFDLSCEWDGRTVTVTFYPADGSEPVCLPVENGPVRVPDEVMGCRGRSAYVLSGEGDGSVLRSLAGYLDVLDPGMAGRHL